MRRGYTLHATILSDFAEELEWKLCDELEWELRSGM